jgi:predicted permease
MIFFTVILPIFIIIATGYIFEKIKHPDFKSISDLTLYFLAPCLIFEALLKHNESISSFTFKLIIFMIFLTCSLWIVSFLFSKLFKLNSQEQAAVSLSTVMMNCGNFGLPLILFAFGEKALFYAVVVLVIFTFPLGTLAVFIASKGKASIKNSLIEITRIPLLYSILFATFFKYFNIHLPQLILKPIILMGEGAIPALLILLGMQLARTDFKANLKIILGNSFLRLIISPILALIFVKLIGFSGLLAKVVILQTSTPSAIIPLLYAINYDTKPDIVAGSIFFSTIISALTLTILLYFIGI